MSTAGPKPTRKKRRLWIILGSIVLVFALLRLALPTIVLHVVNNKLAALEDYTGHVEDIDILLIAGRYTINDIRVDKRGGKVPVPFFSAKRVDFSVEWKALFKGGIVGEIEVDEAKLNFVKGPTKATSQTEPPPNWDKTVSDLMPLQINRFEISNSEMHYSDFHSKPKVDVTMKNIHIVATNLRNVNDNAELLPSTANASAEFYGGTGTVGMKINALAKEPTFDLNAELKGMDLTKVNDFLMAYGNFEVRKGVVGLYTEAAAKKGRIAGYVKPILKDIDVIQGKGNFVKVVWEAVVGASAWIFKNHRKDQVATRVEFEGSLKDPNMSILSIVGQTLRNAFIEAIRPSLEGSIDIKNVDTKGEKKGGIIKTLFGGKDKKKENKEEPKKK
jgi:hypothetical protein